MPDAFVFRPDDVSGRWLVGDRELHCGDVFQLSYVNGWKTVRIELVHDEWMLIGVDPKSITHAELWRGSRVRECR